MNSRRPALALSVLGALLLAACGATPEPPAGNLAGADIGGAFTLVDQDGRRVTDRDFAGKYRLMYFGYTFCPDVCPVDVQEMGQGLKAFEAADPARAARVAPIFVTVDPARDTPAALKQFVAAFHPRMIGLTGDEAALGAAKKTFRVYGERAPGGTENYLVDHSAMTYLFGPDGKPIAFVGHDEGAAAIRAMLDAHVV